MPAQRHSVLNARILLHVFYSELMGTLSSVLIAACISLVCYDIRNTNAMKGSRCHYLWHDALQKASRNDLSKTASLDGAGDLYCRVDTQTIIAAWFWLRICLEKRGGGWIIVSLYVLGNLPYLIIQRHNRPKLLRLLARLNEKGSGTWAKGREGFHESSSFIELQHGAGAQLQRESDQRVF